MAGLGFGMSMAPRRLNHSAQGGICTLPAAPTRAPLSAMVMFGQDSADKIAADSADGTRRLTLPTTAILRPNGMEDWFVAIHCRTGKLLRGANYEVLASNGSSVSSGNTSAAIALYDRAITSPAGMNWRWQVAINNASGKDLLAGLAPALNTQPLAKFGDYCLIFGVCDNKPQLGIWRLGDSAPSFLSSANDVRSYNGYYFPAAQYSTATVERSGNVLTFRRASIAAAYQTDTIVLIQSLSQPEINNSYVITGRLAGNAGFTAASIGPDFGVSAADASVSIMRAPADIFTTLGGFANPLTGDNYGWAGGVQRIECRHGTMPVSDGLMDAAWLRDIAEMALADTSMPGLRRYASTLSPISGLIAEPDGIVTAPCMAIGNPWASPSAGADWLVMDEWDHHTPFASDLNASSGSPTGTIRIGFSSRWRTGPIFAQIEDATGTILLPERRVSGGSNAAGRGKIIIPGVPNGTALHVRFRAGKSGFTMIWGPISVGPSFAIISQSTLNTLFSISSGNSLAPPALAQGMGTVGDVAGAATSALTDAAPTPTNGPNYCRLARRHITNAGMVGDGIAAFTAKLIELQHSASGKAMAAAAYNLCRSGHPADIFWADRRSFTNSIGTSIAGQILTGTWKPHPLWVSSVTYIEAGTAELWRGGMFAQANPLDTTSPFFLSGGEKIATSDAGGNWIADNGSGVTGSINADTGEFSIHDPIGGPLTITARMQFDTTVGTTSSGRQAIDGFTVWGDDGTPDSGHISNLIKAMPRQTAFIWSWANYLLGWANSRTQAQVNEKVAFDIAMVRGRINAAYPDHAGTPWIIAADARTKSTSSIGQHRIRIALRNYAQSTPNTHWSIGPITGDMDSFNNSPHPGPLASSGQLWGISFAHGAAKSLGITGAKADEVFITAAERSVDGSYVDLTFNVPAGANLTSADPTKIEGLYFAATDDAAAMALVDVAGGTYSTSLPAANMVRVTKVSGTFPAVTYWAAHVGFVLTDAVFATENLRLANTLSLDTGGYNGIRPGQPISFNPMNVQAAQA